MFPALKFEASQQVNRGEKQGSGERGPGKGLLVDTVGVSSSLKALPKVDRSPNILHKTDPCYSIFHLPTFLVEDLIKYLDPEYIDRIAIPDASKLQFILAGVHIHLGIWIMGELGHRDGLPANPNG